MPLPSVQHSITLFGSAPWGFRLSGGKEFGQPLVITRVTPGSLAAKSGIQSGDVLIAVDGQFVRDLSQDECEAKVRQARGSLHLKLEKNAAKVTETPDGQVTVDGDRSIYDKTTETQKRMAKYNRSAKPFGAPTNGIKKAEETSTQASGFRSISFQPKSPAEPIGPTTTLPTSARGDPDGTNSISSDMSKVKINSQEPPQSTNSSSRFINTGSYNRKPAPFQPGNISNNSNVSQADEGFPPPPDFPGTPNVETKQSNPQAGVDLQPTTTVTKKRVVLGPNSALGLYSQENAKISYDAQVEDL